MPDVSGIIIYALFMHLIIHTIMCIRYQPYRTLYAEYDNPIPLAKQKQQKEKSKTS